MNAFFPVRKIKYINLNLMISVYKNVLIILDDSFGVGVLGKNLRGTLEHFGLGTESVDLLCCTMEFVFDTVGGFVVGDRALLEKQRLFASGYIFSACAPPFTCTAGRFGLKFLFENGEKLRGELNKTVSLFRSLTSSKSFTNLEMYQNDNLPFVQLKSSDGDNKKLSDFLKKNGFFAGVRGYVNDDWCRDNFVRLNLSVRFQDEDVKRLVNCLEEYGQLK